MSNDLRSRVIRLAHQNPSLRPHLLPLLKQAASLSEREVELIRIMAIGANAGREREKEWERKVQTPGTPEYKQKQENLARIAAAQAEWTKLEDQWILQVPGRSVAALPTSGKQSSAKFVIFDLNTRKVLVAQLMKTEVRDWLMREALQD